MREFLRTHLDQVFKIVYQPQIGNLAAHFECVTQLVIACGSMIYAIDEVDKFCSASFLPPGLKDLVNYGRHRKISMIVTTRRPAQVARELTSQCSEFRLFRSTEPLDIRYFAEYIGPSNAEKLRSLDKYKYLCWRDDDSEPQILGGAVR